MTQEVVLVRHGETELSRDCRHTGRTDVPLTDVGREQAKALASCLSTWEFAKVLTSPLGRAMDTCRLAGHGNRAELRDDRVIAEVASVDGDVALFAHGHVLRVPAARWVGLAPELGRSFALGTATISVLGYERETRVILRWDQPCG